LGFGEQVLDAGFRGDVALNDDTARGCRLDFGKRCLRGWPIVMEVDGDFRTSPAWRQGNRLSKPRAAAGYEGDVSSKRKGHDVSLNQLPQRRAVGQVLRPDGRVGKNMAGRLQSEVMVQGREHFAKLDRAGGGVFAAAVGGADDLARAHAAAGQQG